MKSIKQYIVGFLNRAGSHVFIATVIARLLSFFASWIALQLIASNPLGQVLYAWNMITFLIPLVGLGLHQSYIRYGALTTSENEKQQLLRYVIRKGTFVSLFLTVVIILITSLLTFKIPDVHRYLYIVSLVFIPTFLLEIIRIRMRLEHNNKKYAQIEIVYNLLLVFSVTTLSYFFQSLGYAFSFVIAPLLTVLIFSKVLRTTISKKLKLKFINLEFWKYGFFGGLSNVVTILLFAIDIVLIGAILKDASLVTAYRYISLIPFSLLFLPRVFITTDFVSFTEKIADQNFIKEYSNGYVRLFLIISGSILLLSFLFSSQILYAFDASFVQYKDSFLILLFGICGILILRGLYGNLLSSIGKVKINFYITAIAVIINYITNQQLISLYGIKGAAITSAILMWGTGITSALLFHFEYKKFLSTFKQSQ